MRRHMWGLYVAAVLLVAALGAVAAVASSVPEDGTAPAKAPLAVVLEARAETTRLDVVDLVRRRVVRHVALHSFVTDIDVDRQTGVVAAAQSGGIGASAEDELSLTDPRTGRVRYVRLPFSDPCSVVCSGGVAYVLHALVQPEGLAVSVVDIPSASVLRSGHVPDGPGIWAWAGSDLWSGALREEGGWSVLRIDPTTLATATVDLPGFTLSGVVASRTGVVLLGASGGPDRPGPARVVLLDAAKASAVASVPAPGLRYRARLAARVGERLVVGDWGGEVPETRRLEVYDARTLGHERTIDLDGVPCALATWGDRLVVMDRSSGGLRIVDPATGSLAGRVDVGARGLAFSDVVVVEGR